MKSDNRIKIIIFIFFCACFIVNHLIGYFGHYGFDDMIYARGSADLLHGKFDVQNHFSFRWIVIGFTALSYLLFGINDFASSLPALIISLTTLFLLFIILSRHHSRIVFFGLALFTLNPWTLFYSDKLMPDVYVAFFVLLSLYIIYHYRYISSGSAQVVHAFFLAASFFCGFISKETIALFVPFLFFLFLSDVFQKKYIRFWLWSMGFVFLLFIFYFAAIWIISGNFLQRFDAIINNSYLNKCSYDQQPVIFLLRRISYELIFDLIKQSMFTGSILLFVSLVYSKFRDFLRINDEKTFFIFSAFVLLLSSNFMSISFTGYVPMCIDPRHYLFLIPITAICGAHVMDDFTSLKKYRYVLLLFTLCIVFISYSNEFPSFERTYLPLFIFFLIVAFIPSFTKKWNIVFPVIFTGILLIEPWYYIRYARQVNYSEQREIVTKQLIFKNEKSYVITDPVQKHLGTYFTRFDDQYPVRFIHFGETDSLHDDHLQTIYMVINSHTMYLSNISFEQLPYFARMADKFYKEVYSGNNMKIYRVIRLIKPLLLFSHQIDFEKENKDWQYSEQFITKEKKYRGNQSYQVPEFSATCKTVIDSGLCDSSSSLIVQGSLFIYATDVTQTELIISLEQENKTYYWQSERADPFIKSFGAWWEVKIERIIPCSSIKDHSMIGFYLWNSKKKEIYMDDATLIVYKIQVRK